MGRSRGGPSESTPGGVASIVDSDHGISPHRPELGVLHAIGRSTDPDIRDSEYSAKAPASANDAAGDHARTVGELGYLVVLATFFEQLWPVVGLDIAAVRAGTAPPVPIDIRPAALPGTPGVPADNHTAVSQAFRCGDNAWPRDLATYRRDLTVLTGQFPAYGPANANVGPCAFWPTSQDNTIPLASNRARGALVLAALRDASVPLPNAVATRDAIRGSRLVTVDRRVHVPLLSGEGTACMNAAVTGYLLTGRLPATDLAC
jgi:TAP-like protein